MYTVLLCLCPSSFSPKNIGLIFEEMTTRHHRRMGTPTKHPSTKRPATKRPATKRPASKTSSPTKRPAYKTSMSTKRPCLQNVLPSYCVKTFTFINRDVYVLNSYMCTYIFIYALNIYLLQGAVRCIKWYIKCTTLIM